MPINYTKDKSEIFDPLTRALVSCPNLRSCIFANYLFRGDFNKLAFNESYKRALIAAQNESGCADDFTVKIMQVSCSPNGIYEEGEKLYNFFPWDKYKYTYTELLFILIF